MSYNFAISRPPVPNEIDDPWSWINKKIEEAHADDAQKPHADFVKLHGILTEKYPCICDLSDDEIDDGVWSDGPLINNFMEDVAVLGISYSRVQEVGGDIYQIIINEGFVVFDYAGEQIYQKS